MTAIGKVLVFLNLVIGVGIAVSSTAVMTQRPTWFTALPEGGGGIDKGHYPVAFAQLAADIDSLGKQATAASTAWGGQLESLKAAEKTRKDRAGQTAKLLTDAVSGDKGAFYNLSDDDTTKLLNLDTKDAKAVVGPDGQPLAGANTLLSKLEADAKAVHGTPDENNVLKGGLVQESSGHRAKLKTLGEQIVLVETQVLKQRVIRDHQLNEAAYLAAFEVNVAEQLETVRGRKRQLVSRLKLFE